MKIPILNFLLISKYKNDLIKNKQYTLSYNHLNFHKCHIQYNFCMSVLIRYFLD